MFVKNTYDEQFLLEIVLNPNFASTIQLIQKHTMP